MKKFIKKYNNAEVMNMKKDMELNDLRGEKSPIKGHIITAGIQLNEDNIKMMLTMMGVDPTIEMISGALGYMSANGSEITMNNLGDYLKSKNILSSVPTIDMRTSAKKK